MIKALVVGIFFLTFVELGLAKEKLKVRSVVDAACNGQVEIVDLFENVPESLNGCSNFIENIESNKSLAVWKSLCEQRTSEKIDLYLAPQLQVQRHQTLPASWIKRRVLERLPATLAMAEIELIRTPDIKEVCETNEYIDIASFNVDNRGGYTLEVRIANQRRWLNGQYKIFAQMPVAKRAIAPQEKINSLDFDFRRSEITHLKDMPLSQEELNGVAFRHGLSLGQIPFKADIYREPMIVRGQLVRVRMASALLEISGQVQAEQPGFANDIIRVKNMESQKVLSARVVEQGVVEIQ